MKPTKENLIDEIVKNARSDRKRLEAVANGLTNTIEQLEDDSETQGIDPEVSAAFAEELSKITDSLSKVDQRLVELVKLETKNEVDPKKSKTGMSEAEKEDLYDQVADEGLN